MFLFITNEDIKRDTELTIDYRLIPWEGEREFTNKSSSNEDLVVNQHTIKEIVESNQPEKYYRYWAREPRHKYRNWFGF